MITRRFIQDNKATVITLDPKLEHLILERAMQNEAGSYVALEAYADAVHRRQPAGPCGEGHNQGKTPIVLTSPLVRESSNV
jgi:flagellar biosynthesis protein FlhA